MAVELNSERSGIMKATLIAAALTLLSPQFAIAVSKSVSDNFKQYCQDALVNHPTDVLPSSLPFEDLFPAWPALTPDRAVSPKEYRFQSVSEFYQRSLERTSSPQISTVVADAHALNADFELHVDHYGFWISKSHSIVTEKVKMRDRIASSDSSKASLPNSLLKSGNSKWLFSIFNANSRQIDIFGISATSEKVEIKYLFRIWLFGQEIESPPFLSLGPSVSYKGADGHLQVYWFDTFGSADVEPVYRSEQPLIGDLSSAEIDKSGQLTYVDGAGKHEASLFTSSPEWEDYVRRLEGR
jgi:hypothetical protein